MYCAINGALEYRQNCDSYQLVKSLYSIANGGYGGTGIGNGTFQTVDGTPLIPYLETDFVYSAIAQELGLIGAAAVLLCYLALVARGMRVALIAQDGFSKLLAAGLSFGFALQTFIIVGGVLRIVPLTGITLPFVSYGGYERRRELRDARAPDARLPPRRDGTRADEPPADTRGVDRDGADRRARRRRRRTGRPGRGPGSRRDRTTRSSGSRSSRSGAG